MTRIAKYDFDAGRVVISGGPGGWAVTRTTRGSPPVVDIVVLDDQSDITELVEKAIRGDRHAAERLLTIKA